MQALIAILVACQAVTAVTGGIVGGSMAEGTDLGALCAGKAIDLVSFTQLKDLVAQLNDEPKPRCPDHIKNALIDLEVLFEANREDVCTMEKVNHIKDYYNVYVDTSDASTSASRTQIPKSLERFVIAYAMQMSSHCKLHMMGVLFEKGVNPLSIADFRELDQWTKDGGPIANLLSTIGKKGEIILPGDLVAVMPDKKLVQKLIVKTSENGRLEPAKEVCSKRFKPVYEPVVTPVAALSRAGFDLPDVLLKIHKPENVEVLYEGMRRWSRVVFLCEVLDLIELSKGDPETTEQPMMDFGPTFEQIAYVHVPSGELGSHMISSYDSKLKQMLKSFSTSKSEFERMKDKLIKRSWRLLKARLRNGEYMAMFRLALDKLSSKPGKGDVNDRELDLINREIADSFESKKESAISKAFGGATRPVKRYAQSIVALMTIFEVIKGNSLMSFKEMNELRNESPAQAEE